MKSEQANKNSSAGRIGLFLAPTVTWRQVNKGWVGGREPPRPASRSAFSRFTFPGPPRPAPRPALPAPRPPRAQGGSAPRGVATRTCVDNILTAGAAAARVASPDHPPSQQKNSNCLNFKIFIQILCFEVVSPAADLSACGAMQKRFQ